MKHFINYFSFVVGFRVVISTHPNRVTNNNWHYQLKTLDLMKKNWFNPLNMLNKKTHTARKQWLLTIIARNLHYCNCIICADLSINYKECPHKKEFRELCKRETKWEIETETWFKFGILERWHQQTLLLGDNTRVNIFFMNFTCYHIGMQYMQV